MKHYFAAAGALLLGTSTIALAADVKPLETSGVETAKVATDAKVTTEAKVVTAAKAVDTSDESLLAKSEVDAGNEAKVELASLDGDLAKLASAETDAKVQTASFDTDVKADATAAGMGGPIEAETTTASLTPQPATHNYPPCDPGPGDDSCIQLYEDGVREQLASWNRPTGGLLDDSAATAMGGPFEPVDKNVKADVETATHVTPADSETGVGGPFEPVDNGVAEVARSGDGSIDASAGETAATESGVAEAEVAQHSGFTGVGGPVEAQSGYPACEPGPGDDRCIQLYEAGVSGAGN